MTDSRDPADRGPEETLVSGDDRIIRTALVWSLAVFALIGAAIGGTAWILTRESEPPPVEETELVLPEIQERVATPPEVRFTDVAEAVGLRWRHTNGARGGKLLPETMGPGAAFLDYDQDGDPDILLVDSTHWEDDPVRSAADYAEPTLRLFRNDEGGAKATDVTAEAGLAVSMYGQGLAVADYDNDGDPDVFVTGVRGNRLFRNDGGRFVDVTAEAGVGGARDEWSTSAAFFDADNDGDLDLFVCNYVRWTREIDEAVGHQLTGIGRAYAPPALFEGTQPYFYRNLGDGKFREAAKDAGLHQLNPATALPEAKALGVVPVDADSDGWMDLIVANDTVRNFFFHNRGDGTFEEDGALSGLSYDAAGKSTGAMGIDAAWYRDETTLGIAIGNFANEMSSLYVAEGGDTLFSDEAIAEGIGPVSRQMLSFGLFFFDYDLDGRLDLFQANGHLEEDINTVQPSQQYRQPSQLFWNCGPAFPSCFVPVDSAATGDLGLEVVGRAAAYADWDGDGDLDILLTQTGDRVILLRNDQELGHHWARLRLVGTKSSRDAIGAVVELTAGGLVQRQQVAPARSYLASVETTLTFGLGHEDTIESLRIRWPGTAEAVSVEPPAVDRLTVIRQP